MSRNLYVTLPVKDVQRSVDFFAALGFSFNPKFASENGAALTINDNTHVMLASEAFFSTLTKVPITDARKATEALLALSLDSRMEVDAPVSYTHLPMTSRTRCTTGKRWPPKSAGGSIP